MSSHAPHGHSMLRAVQVLGGGSSDSGAHVRSLTAGLTARGVQVTVCAPAEAERIYCFTGSGAWHLPLPQCGGPASVAALRVACADADVVHAHGPHAALRAAVALAGRRTPLVVTWHGRSRQDTARAIALRLLEQRAARAASVVLGATSQLVDHARARGARDVRLAAVAPVRPPVTGPGHADAHRPGDKARAELGAVGRPLIVALGALEPRGGHDVLLDATHAWSRLDPQPLLVIAGEGSSRGPLERRITQERLPVRLIGHREQVTALLAVADLAVLAAAPEAAGPPALEALHARVPLVASAAGGAAEVVAGAAELVPHGDAYALGSAVLRLLADPARRELLKERGAARAAAWPTEDETVAQVLSVYDELTSPLPSAGPVPRR